MLAAIPSTIRVKAVNGVVNIPSHGLVSDEPVLVLMTNFRGPRRKLVWGFIQRAIAVGALAEVKVGVPVTAPDTAPDTPETDPQPAQPVADHEPETTYAQAGGSSPAPVAEPVAVIPTVTASGPATANLF